MQHAIQLSHRYALCVVISYRLIMYSKLTFLIGSARRALLGVCCLPGVLELVWRSRWPGCQGLPIRTAVCPRGIVSACGESEDRRNGWERHRLLAGLCIPTVSGSEGDTVLTKPQNIPAIADFDSCNPRVVGKTTQNVNKKLVNPAISKNRKWEVFRTVNHLNIVWDPKAKPKGILGGHLNIRSIKSKSDQIHHLLMDSTLDFLRLSETWLHENAPSATLKVPGFNIYRRNRVG